MIRRQLVQWVLLPNGLSDEYELSASVFVSPRLRPDAEATLADFPDFADWPATLRTAELVLERGDGATEAPTSVVISTDRLWPALLPVTTTVRAFTFDDLAHRPLVSYPVGEVLGHLRERWASLAVRARDDLPITNPNAAPIGPPPPDARPEHTLVDHFEDARAALHRGVFEGMRDGAELSARLRAALDNATAEARELRGHPDAIGSEPIRPFGAGGSPADALYALAGFHARPSQEQPKPFPADREEARAELEAIHDFHHHLSTLGDHPALLRRLGLVFDLTIRPDFIPTTTDADPPTLLRLVLRRRSAFPQRADDPSADVWNADVTPWTSCRLTNIDGAAFFTAVERTARQNFAHGFLHMDPARYAPMTVDVDGLALKAINMAATLQGQADQEQRPVEEPERDGVPSARTGGIAIVHNDHATELHQDFVQARANDDALANDPDNPPILAAEDLVRGYRMDIWSRGTWRSLHRRRVVYTPERDPDASLEVDDEGSVQLSLTAEVDRPGAPADPDRPLYLHEAMVTWNGWSLSVPRPGHAIPQEPAVPEAGADLGALRLAIATDAVPGSLPRLRFQAGYRTRVRTVDLAGNSHRLPVADILNDVLDHNGDPRYVSSAPAEPLLYRRFEPVPPPELVPRLPYGPGESLERLVVRSAPGFGAAEYAELSQTAADPMLRFQPFCDRHVAAAKASLQLVETHGMLDEAIDTARGLTPVDAAAAIQPYYAIAARESGSFRDAPNALSVPTGEHQGVEQGYVCIDADAVDLPYLPDPLGPGAKASLRLDPDAPEQALEIPFGDGGGWERPLPFRLRLEEGSFTARYDAGERLLTVGLPPGRTARLRLSSLFQFDPDVFAILSWCREVDPGSADLVAAAIAAGTHWMTAPWRDMVLVHATQRPVEQPALALDTGPIKGLVPTLLPALARARGATALELAGWLTFDLPSTGRLDVSAAWEEVEDVPDRRYHSPEEMAHPARHDVFSLMVPEPFGTPWLPDVAPFIKPEERTVRFRTRGDRGDKLETPARQRLALLAAAAAPGLTAPARRRLEAAAAQLETLHAHELGDTRYRRVTYQPIAATRFREYFDPEMPVEDGISAGETLSFEVLSSAPPAKPTVLQVLPLMDTQRSSVGSTTTSRRTGIGLRVWLGRPWFSSGAGELLAVVCDVGGRHVPDGRLSREITMILQDPAHASTVPLPLTMRSVRGGVRHSESVPLHGGADRQDVVGFQPVWNAERQAWFCDVELDNDMAYFPFVRLGLARYQPMAIPGCELSPIVPTAFVQTVPDRTLTCAVPPGRSAEVALSGPAPSASMNALGVTTAGTNVVTATIEARDRALADPLLGWAAAGPEAELSATLNDDGTATWTGAIPVPDVDGRELRLTVREFEIHSADDRSAEPSLGFIATRRLVHADVVPL